MQNDQQLIVDSFAAIVVRNPSARKCHKKVCTADNDVLTKAEFSIPIASEYSIASPDKSHISRGHVVQEHI